MKTYYHWLNFKIKEITYRFINLAVYMSFHRCVRRIQLGWVYVLLFQYVFNICYYGHTILQIVACLLSCHVNTSHHMVLAVQLHIHSFLHVGSFVWRHQLQLCAHTIDLWNMYTIVSEYKHTHSTCDYLTSRLNKQLSHFQISECKPNKSRHTVGPCN